VSTVASGPILAIAIPVAVFVVMFVVAVGLYLLWRNLRSPEAKNTEIVPVKRPSIITSSDKAFQIKFSQLELGRVIAHGAEGQVREGKFGGITVAIKELMSVLFDPTQVEALQAETSFLCSLHHPNIVRFYGMSVDNSNERGASYYLVSDMKKTDLRKVLDSEPQPSHAEVMRMASEICSPLEYLHSMNMVHRDLKPENVLVDNNRTLFLCDFGLSKEYDDSTNVDMTTNMGTAAYMAPELSDARKFVADFSQDDSEIALAATGGDKALVEKHSADMQNMQNVDLEMAESSKPKAHKECLRTLSSFRAVSPVEDKSSKVTSKSELVFKLDCYSFGIVLWVLMGWELPFRNITPMQILIAVGYQNKRPSTKKIIAAGWPEPVIRLMRELWSTSPEERPSMAQSREILSQFVS